MISWKLAFQKGSYLLQTSMNITYSLLIKKLILVNYKTYQRTVHSNHKGWEGNHTIGLPIAATVRVHRKSFLTTVEVILLQLWADRIGLEPSIWHSILLLDLSPWSSHGGHFH